MESLQSSEDLSRLPDLKAIESKVNDPKTSWGELTVLREDLELLLERASASYAPENIKGQKDAISNLLEKVQKRINAEEPDDIQEMRHELTGLTKDIVTNYKEYIQNGEYEKLMEAVRRNLEIEFTSKGKAADINVSLSQFSKENIQRGVELFEKATYQQWKEQGEYDIESTYNITPIQAEALFNFAKNAFLTGDNYMKLATMFILIGLNT